MRISLSNRQYPMIQAFLSLGAGRFMSITDAKAFDQRPFRSMLIQGWVSYRASHGFYLTKEGRAAWEDYHHTDIARKNPSLPLTSYFDPETYGLKRDNVRVLKPKGHSAVA